MESFLIISRPLLVMVVSVLLSMLLARVSPTYDISLSNYFRRSRLDF